jgi:hypothetical protein
MDMEQNGQGLIEGSVPAFFCISLKKKQQKA